MTVAAKATYFWRSALQGLRHSPFVHFVAVSTIGIALFTAGLARSASRLLDSMVASIGGEVEMTVYFAEGTSEDQARSLADAFQKRVGGAVTLVTPADALGKLQRELGDQGDVLAKLPENPLPMSLEIKVPPASRSPQVLKSLAADFKKSPLVAGVDYGEEAVARLSAISKAVKYGGIGAFAIIVLATVIIVSATLQLAIYARRDEIEIQKLVGGTDRFVKVPFLIEGLFQGLIGAGLAMAGLWAFAWAVGPRLAQLFAFILGPNVQIALVDPRTLGELIVTGCALGLSGSFIAVGRFLRV